MQRYEEKRKDLRFDSIICKIFFNGNKPHDILDKAFVNGCRQVTKKNTETYAFFFA